MLENHQAAVEEERNSRKEPLSDDDARALIAQVSAVWVAKGKKIRELAAGEAVLDDLKGPTGNYRAPIVRAGERVDAVDLDEAECVEHAFQVLSPAGSRSGAQQQMSVQKQPAGAAIVQKRAGHPAIYRR